MPFLADKLYAYPPHRYRYYEIGRYYGRDTLSIYLPGLHPLKKIVDRVLKKNVVDRILKISSSGQDPKAQKKKKKESKANNFAGGKKRRKKLT